MNEPQDYFDFPDDDVSLIGPIIIVAVLVGFGFLGGLLVGWWLL